MKKTEILKVRVDKETHTALMRYCEGNGQSPSSVLRRILSELIRESDGIRPPAGGPEGEDSSRYARGLAAILIAGHLSVTRRAQQQSPNRHHQIARLVDELLQTICGNDGQEPTTHFPSGEMPGPALTPLAANPEPKYG
jgi:hypothetical protein